MFYSEEQAYSMCLENNNLIFELIKENYSNVLNKIIENNSIDFNILDNDGNTIIMRLLKNKNYDLVLKLLDNSNIDINHQNNNGNTFSHILVTHNYLSVKNIIDKLFTIRKFKPNLKNNLGETILDKAINDNYIYTVAKILEFKRFTDVNLVSFKNYYEAYIKNNSYGEYSKIYNFDLIMNSLEKKNLSDSMKDLFDLLNNNKDDIKEDFSKLENIVKKSIKEI